MKNLSLLITAIVCLAPLSLEAQPGSLSARDQINGERTTRAFAEALKGQELSVAEIRRNHRVIALATIVSEDGLLLTKASELKGSFSVRLPDGRQFESAVVESDSDEDVALVQVPAKGLFPVHWSSSEDLKIGHWVSGFDADEDRVHIGIVAAKRRPLKRVGGVMGVRLAIDDDSVEGVQIERVYPRSGANAAGLKRRDVVLSIEGKRVMGTSELREAVMAHDPGERIRVRVRRAEEEIEVEVTLGDRDVVLDVFNRDLEFSGETSTRRSGFGNVIQHDVPLGARSMGGPLFSLDGAACGIQMARFDRVATFAIPSELALVVLERLKAKLIPHVN